MRASETPAAGDFTPVSRDKFAPAEPKKRPSALVQAASDALNSRFSNMMKAFK